MHRFSSLTGREGGLVSTELEGKAQALRPGNTGVNCGSGVYSTSVPAS